jgi:hypothetical protein
MPHCFAVLALKFVTPALKNARNMKLNIVSAVLKNVEAVLKNAGKWPQHTCDQGSTLAVIKLQRP